MCHSSAQPRILFVSPDVKFVPISSDPITRYMVIHSEGFTDILSGLIIDLYDLGIDVHVVQPDYRQIFKATSGEKQEKNAKKIPVERVHLTEDRVFYYSKYTASNYKWENIKISIAFQREGIYHIIPTVQPDLIHCHDWISGLIPAKLEAFGQDIIQPGPGKMDGRGTGGGGGGRKGRVKDAGQRQKR